MAQAGGDPPSLCPPAGQQRSLSGLEGTAAGGAGPGIEAFKRQAPRRTAQPGGSSSGSGGAFQLGAASKQAPRGGAALDAGALDASRLTQLRPWGEDALRQALAPAPGGTGGGNALANFLTTTYAKYQGAAGRRVGIAPGEAWRVALRAAVAAGASQVCMPALQLAPLAHALLSSAAAGCMSNPPCYSAPPQVLLGDAPADTTGRRLADGILRASLPLLLGAAVASVTSAIVLSQGLADSGAPPNPLAVAALSAVPLGAALAPVLAPLVEVARFAGMSAQQIEETVRLQEPVQVGFAWRCVMPGRGGRLLAPPCMAEPTRAACCALHTHLPEPSPPAPCPRCARLPARTPPS